MTQDLPSRRQAEELKSDKAQVFEDELSEFFKDRAEARAIHVSDKPKDTCSESRAEEDPSMSGCCMTGCHDCPWGYTVPLSETR